MLSAHKTQGLIKFKTPAKVNSFLHILGKRDDGYHEVCLSLIPISLFDHIILKKTPDAELTLVEQSPWSLGAPEKNLIFRAVKLFEAQTGIPQSWEITLQKEIPPGAGLAGGSGNAGGILRVLNDLHQSPLSQETLCALALELGADVGFFLQPRPAIGRGRGEKITPLTDFPPLNLLVLKPPFSISTAKAYQDVNPTPEKEAPTHLKNTQAVVDFLENGFESTLFPQYPVLPMMKNRLLALGAEGALLSGSGSALFGVFPSEEAQLKACEVLSGETDWLLWACQSLSSHTYLDGEEGIYL